MFARLRARSAASSLLRDDLDEDGGGDPDCEAAAGSGVMIVADLQLCKFFSPPLLDCR
jgi:hypothetical protein